MLLLLLVLVITAAYCSLGVCMASTLLTACISSVDVSQRSASELVCMDLFAAVADTLLCGFDQAVSAA
jgi:hypothetical protein